MLADRAVLFVDGRYTLQAREQIDPAIFTIAHLVETPPDQWIEKNLPAGARLGYDPWLHTAEGAEKLAKACSAVGATLVPLPMPTRSTRSGATAPPRRSARSSLHDLRFAGEDAGAKLERIRAETRQAARRRAGGLRSARGGLDVQHPRRRRRAHAAAARLRARSARRAGRRSMSMAASSPTRCATGSRSIADVREPGDLTRDLAALGAAAHAPSASIRRPRADALVRLVSDAGGKPARGPDPIALLKAVKNPTEIEGARAAHRRDGAAMARFLAWFDREAPPGKLTEIDAVEALESFRRESGLLKDVSFPTIAGAGPNGAIVHYRVTRDRPTGAIATGELFLIDSGGQYEDGTTDITRTVTVGDAERGNARRGSRWC